MKMWGRFCTLSRARQIAIAVFALHFAVIFILSVHHLTHPKKTTKGKIAVRTVRPPIPKAIVSSQSSLNHGDVFQKTTKKTQGPKKTVSQKISPKKTGKNNSSSSQAKPKISPDEEVLLQEIADNLEILNSEVKTSSRQSLSLPVSLPKCIKIEEDTFSDPDYGEILTAFLQSVLDLPEYGEVKVRLEISSSGQLADCEILETRNKKNEDFLKNRLRELTFPSFDGFDITDKTLSFNITFKNVENN